MQGGTKKAGFTLIELLIVVAIIAILAAIAIPNFLEAQTRSKAARVKADIRTLAMACEAYRVDWNSYTYRNGKFANPEQNDFSGFRLLTTPVAYVTTIPEDPFGESRAKGEFRAAYFEMGAGVAGVASTGPVDALDPLGFPSDTYMIESDGPDHIDDTVAPNAGGWSFSTGGYPWPNKNDNANNLEGALALRYDPTNGTVSSGEIYRCGGAKGPGRMMAAFYEGSSK